MLLSKFVANLQESASKTLPDRQALQGIYAKRHDPGKMSIIKNIGFVFLLLVWIISCKDTRSSAERQVLSPLTSKLDSIGQSFINSGQILGLTVAIKQSTDTLYNKGFGYLDAEKTRPATNQTRFLMASVSKLIGSTIVMKLVDEGKISLDQTLFELLPDFPNSEQAKKITLRHMLSHTSGLQDYAAEIDSFYVKTRIDPTKDDIYDFLKNKKLFFEPGSDFSYCNTGFLLMGLIVEKITGQSFQNEVDRVINQPTGMNVKLIAEAIKDPEMSPYWEFKDSTFINKPHWTWIKGDGGLTATSIMLAQFPRGWANGEIISAEAFKAMSSPTVLNNGIETGYGVGVRNGEFLGEKIIGHTGGHKSTYSIMVYFPERDMTFVCFMNTDNTPTGIRSVFAEFSKTVLQKKIPNYKDQEVAGSNLTVYEGTYRNFDYKMENIVSIERNDTDHHLYYCMDNDCVKMYDMGEHKFWIEQWPYDFVSFYLDEQGESLALREYYTGFYSVLREKLN